MEVESGKLRLIKFDQEYSQDSDSYYLFEMSEEMLKQLEGGETFKIFGRRSEDPAILTTSSSTFKLRRNDFSNSFYILESPARGTFVGASTLTVKGNLNSCIDFIKIQPNKREIYSELVKRQLTKATLSTIVPEDCKDNLINLDDDCFQISRAEFQKFIVDLNLVEAGDDCFLKLSEELEISLIQNHVLRNIKQSELLNRDHFLDKLDETPLTSLGGKILLKAVRKHFDVIIESPLQFRVDVKKLLAFFALEILIPKKAYFLNEFLTVFEMYTHKTLPANFLKEWSEKERAFNTMQAIFKFTITIDMNDYSLPMPLERKIEIKYFDKQDLPWDIKERIKEIFKLKKKYFYEELEEIFADMCNKKEFEDFLPKCTKAIHEKLSKSNRPFFERIYPAFTNNLSEDKASPGNFIIRYFTSKLLED